MKKHLRKWLRHWLFPDVAELANYQIHKLREEELPPMKKRKDFLISARKIYREPAFKLIIQTLVDRQIEHAVRYSDCWDRVLFDRATINGFELLVEELKDLITEFDLLAAPTDDEFDKHDIV